jgi:hypothetical protein
MLKTKGKTEKRKERQTFEAWRRRE